MIGVIAGDIVGSVYEFTKHKQYDFQPLFHNKSKFTDDTVCVYFFCVSSWRYDECFLN